MLTFLIIKVFMVYQGRHNGIKYEVHVQMREHLNFSHKELETYLVFLYISV